MKQDDLLRNLLDLDGVRYVVQERLGLWVKFDAREIEASQERPHGVRYSLTLHDRCNKRIMGFDNAHIIPYRGKKAAVTKKAYDHWHRGPNDEGRPYHYVNAGKLIEDFWKEVEKILNKLEEEFK